MNSIVLYFVTAKKCIELLTMKIIKLNFIKNTAISTNLAISQESFILNYEDYIKKVTQDIAQFSKKTIILEGKGESHNIFKC